VHFVATRALARAVFSLCNLNLSRAGNLSDARTPQKALLRVT
jgi:hypothetical protein